MIEYKIGDRFSYKLGYNQSVITITDLPNEGKNTYSARIDFPEGSVIYADFEEGTIGRWNQLDVEQPIVIESKKNYATNVKLDTFLRAAKRNNLKAEHYGTTVGVQFDKFLVEVAVEDGGSFQKGDLRIEYENDSPSYFVVDTFPPEGLRFLIDIIQLWMLQ